MIVEVYRDHFRDALKELYEPEEIESLCFLTFEHVLKMNRVEVSLSRKQELSPPSIDALNEVLTSLQRTIPIQYIIGKTEFYGMEFQVNPATLIPRPETEELVEWIINSRLNIEDSRLKILDIGTGSGCIAISLAKNLSKATVEAIDISQNALATAYQNASANQVEVTFYDQNILETEELDEYDIIVSNPPYVRMLEKAEMKENVLNNEPESALYVPDEDPLLFYRKIGFLAFEFLSKDGVLYVEINEYLGEETVGLLKIIGFSQVELKKDMFGKDRMIKAMR